MAATIAVAVQIRNQNNNNDNYNKINKIIIKVGENGEASEGENSNMQIKGEYIKEWMVY